MNDLQPIDVQQPTRLYSPQDLHTLTNVSFDDVSQREQEAAIQYVRVTTLAEQVREKATHAAFSFDEQVNAWLKRKRSDATKATYRRIILLWQQWVTSHRFHILSVTANDVDAFVEMFEQEHIPPSTQRLYLSACSSFYQHLANVPLIRMNFFQKVSLPKIAKYRKSADEVPVTALVEAIDRFLLQEMTLDSGKGYVQQREAARFLRPAILTMANEGVRIGALPSLRVHLNQSDTFVFTATTKGNKEILSTLSPATMKSYLQSELPMPEPFAGKKLKTLHKALERSMARMKKRSIIPRPYSAHAFRHYFAVNLFKRTGDIFEVCRRLNHADISTTQIYLSSFVDTEIKSLLDRAHS